MISLLLLLSACQLGDLAPASGVASLTLTTGELEQTTLVYQQACMEITVEVEDTRLDPTVSWTLDDAPLGSGITQGSIGGNEAGLCFAPPMAGTYVATVTASLGQLSESATFTVRASENQAPVADAGEDIDARIGDEVELDGTASYDPEGQDYSKRWILVSRPGDSVSAELFAPDTLTPLLVPDVVGTYTVRLDLMDSMGAMSADTVQIEVHEPDIDPVLLVTDETTLDTDLPTLLAAARSVPTFLLDGTGSSHVSDAPLTYAFALSGAVGDEALAEVDTGIARVTVTGADSTGEIAVSLLVDDGASTATTEALLPVPTVSGADATITASSPMSVAPTGDLTGDGFDDLLVSVPQARSQAGRVHLIAGPVTTGGVLTSRSALTFTGAQAGDYLGRRDAVHSFDANGDGIDDLLLGAFDNSADYSHGGAIYLTYGPLTGSIDLEDGSDVRIIGDADLLRLGTRVLGLQRESGAAVLALDGDRTWYGFDVSPGEHVASDADLTFSALDVRLAGDLDGDGLGELALVTTGRSAALLAGPLTGTPIASDGALSFGDASALVWASGDVDGDGYHDLWVGDGENQQAALLAGPITAGVETRLALLNDLLLEDRGTSAATGDLDGDGTLDAVIGDRLVLGPITGNIGPWSEGTAHVALTDEDQPFFAGDLDADGTDDIVWAQRSELELFFGALD